MTDGDDGTRDETVEESPAEPGGEDSAAAGGNTSETDSHRDEPPSGDSDDENGESEPDDAPGIESQFTGGAGDTRNESKAEPHSDTPVGPSAEGKYAPRPHWEYGPKRPGEHGREEDSKLAGDDQLSKELLAYTTGRRSLSPRVQILWAVRTSITAFIFGLIAGFVATNFGLGTQISGVFVVLFLLLGWAWVVARYRVWVYQIREDAIYLERGVFRHVRSLVPYVRIQHVDTSRGPLERALGLSTLVVYTAGSRGADVSIPGLTPEEASDLQQRVKELAIEAEGGDAL